MTEISLKEWIDYLESRVNIDVYVWGGNGQTIILLMPKLCDMEKADHTDKEALANTDRVLTLLQKRLLQGVDIFIICGVDCSGLAVKLLLEKGIIPHDMTANGLWEYIVGTKKTKGHGKEIKLSEVRAGDYLFQGNDSNKWHIGYAISNKYAIESKNHDVGVVKTAIADRGWKYAARPDWYSDAPEPEKPVLKRELYYAKSGSLLRGDDVKDAQQLLLDKGYNPGTVDSIFGKKTEIAVKNFQHDNNLTEDGIIGKVTGTMLGFKWEG